jgi:hypothetical protein
MVLLLIMIPGALPVPLGLSAEALCQGVATELAVTEQDAEAETESTTEIMTMLMATMMTMMAIMTILTR